MLAATSPPSEPPSRRGGSVAGNVGDEEGAATPRADELESPAQRLDPVRQAGETGPILGVGASDAVVLDGNRDMAVALRSFDDDDGSCRLRVFRDVRDRLGDEVV